MAIEQKGNGGTVWYGYRAIASVGDWTYAPVEGGNGEGTISAILADEHDAYADRSDVTLELRTRRGGVLRWPSAEKFGTTFIVPRGPEGQHPRT